MFLSINSTYKRRHAGPTCLKIPGENTADIFPSCQEGSVGIGIAHILYIPRADTEHCYQICVGEISDN